jgi:beta-glucosidase
MTDSTTTPGSADISADGERVFPADFTWGVATSSFQIEGATHEDGRVPSIWDTFSHTHGKIRTGDTADVAADHYHRFREDVAIMAELGVKAYRFSIAWPRIQPGPGRANQRGLDFYRRLVDALLEAGIEPLATLYHWDLPQWIEDEGGWPERRTADAFHDYARVVGSALGDRIAFWSTLNEPFCSTLLSYVGGIHAPGRQDPAAGIAAVHHHLLAHGAAARELQGSDRKVGIVLNIVPILPATGEAADVDAARLIDGLQNRMFLDPVLLGRYPRDVLEHFETFSDLAFLKEGDEDLIHAEIDWLGVNYYMAHRVRARPGATRAPSEWPGVTDIEFLPPDSPVTAMGWGIDPDHLTTTLIRLKDEYPPIPLYITENGAAFEDAVTNDGSVPDDQRVSFLQRHFEAAHGALLRGVDLRGYFVWSLIDNFEWAEGFSKRFGIVRVDYETLERTPKSSAYWYRDVIARNGLDPRSHELDRK